MMTEPSPNESEDRTPVTGQQITGTGIIIHLQHTSIQQIRPLPILAERYRQRVGKRGIIERDNISRQDPIGPIAPTMIDHQTPRAVGAITLRIELTG